MARASSLIRAASSTRSSGLICRSSSTWNAAAVAVVSRESDVTLALYRTRRRCPRCHRGPFGPRSPCDPLQPRLHQRLPARSDDARRLPRTAFWAPPRVAGVSQRGSGPRRSSGRPGVTGTPRLSPPSSTKRTWLFARALVFELPSSIAEYAQLSGKEHGNRCDVLARPLYGQDVGRISRGRRGRIRISRDEMQNRLPDEPRRLLAVLFDGPLAIDWCLRSNWGTFQGH